MQRLLLTINFVLIAFTSLGQNCWKDVTAEDRKCLTECALTIISVSPETDHYVNEAGEIWLLATPEVTYSIIYRAKYCDTLTSCNPGLWSTTFKGPCCEDYSDVNIYVPNAVSNNGDGINDVFQVFVYAEESPQECIIALEDFRIYDRWGNLVYFKKLFYWQKDYWDGKFRHRDFAGKKFAYSFKYGDRVHRGFLTLL